MSDSLEGLYWGGRPVKNASFYALPLALMALGLSAGCATSRSEINLSAPKAAATAVPATPKGVI